MRANEKMKKVLSILLCLCMLAQNFPVVAFAAAEDNLCEHHPVHTPECHYAEAVEGSPCTHDHDDSCGYAEKVEEVLCACEATDENGALVHTEGCGYVAPVEGSDCTHVHDGSCGYVEAVEAHDCHYECAECAAPASEEPSEESSEPAPVCNCGTDDPAIHATTCAVYVAPETAVCYCAEKCIEANIWCDVCGFDYTKCGGTGRAAGYNSIYELPEGKESISLDDTIVSTSGDDSGVVYSVLSLPDAGAPGTVAVSRYNGTATEITIPDSITLAIPSDDYVSFEVTDIAEDAFRDCAGLTSVTLPNTVKTIGKNAFNGCSELASITLPESVTTIGDGAFNGCTDLAIINLDSVESIGDGAFKGTQVQCPTTHYFENPPACNRCDFICTHTEGHSIQSMCVTCAMPLAAQADGKYYETLQKAFDAEPSGGYNLPVYLLRDAETPVTLSQDALIHMNGYSISALAIIGECSAGITGSGIPANGITDDGSIKGGNIGKVTVSGAVTLGIESDVTVGSITLSNANLKLDMPNVNFEKCTVNIQDTLSRLLVLNLVQNYSLWKQTSDGEIAIDATAPLNKQCTLVIRCSHKYEENTHNWTSDICTGSCTLCKAEVSEKYSVTTEGRCTVCNAAKPYTLTLKPVENGKVYLYNTLVEDPRQVPAGDQIVLQVSSDTGYVLDTLTVTDSKDVVLYQYPVEDSDDSGAGDDAWLDLPNATNHEFTMPADNITVAVAFKDCPEHIGGTATCTKQAICDACGASYGNADPDNHTWENGECTECDAKDPTIANPTLDISKGSITLTDGKITQAPTYAEQPYSGVLTITGESSSNTVTVNEGNHNIVLQNCSISSTTSAAFAIASYATVGLTLDGTNTLSSGAGYAGLAVPDAAQLVVSGTGSLTATGGTSAAGIGGDCGKSGGIITIHSGTVTAKGGDSANNNGGGAGIGSGANTDNQPITGGYITINGGKVTATGGAGSGSLGSGAGIGGGGCSNGKMAGTAGNVTITGGTVVAAAGTVANLSLLGFDIGRGGSSIPTQPNTGTVTITGGNIKAPKVFPMPKDADGNALSLVTITLAEASAGDKPYRLYSGDNEIAYNISGSELLDTSKLYVYLPVTDDTPAVSSVVAGAYRYHKSEDPWDGSSSSGYSATFTKETVQYAYADVRVDSVVSPLRFTYQAAAFSGSDQLLGTFTYYNGNESSVTLTVETNDDGLDFHGSKSISIPMGSSKDINITLLSVNEDALVADQYAQVGSIRVMLGTELLAEVPVEVKLVQVLPEGTPPTAQTLTYSGEAQELITAGTTEEKAEAMQYSLDNQNWGTAIPTATNAGTYTVYYKVPGNLYFTEVTATDVNVTILPKEVTAPTFEDIHVNSIEPLEITFKLMDGDTEIPASEYTASCIKTATPGTATITVTDKDGGNYTVSGTTTTPYCDHSGHDGAYDIVEDTHSFTCSVCGTSVTEEPHTFTDGICKCDTRATYTVTVTESDSEGGNPYLTNTDKATHGVQFSTFIKMGQDADAWYTDVVKVTVDGRELVKNVDYSYQPTLVQLIIYDTSVTGPIEIFAKVNAKVTFQLNGGDVESGRKEQLAAGGLTVTDGKIDMPLAYGMPSSFGSTVEALNQIFLREGYRCTGLKNGDAAADLDAPVKNCTLTVQWEANTYSVTWIADGETHATTDQVYDAALVLPEAPAKTGFIFDGWYTAAEGGDPVTAQTVYRTAGESTYYAHWTECNHSGNTSKPADAGEGKHSFNCSVCSETVTENHSLDSATGKCGGCETDLAVAKVTSGGVDTYHETLASALTAAKSGDTVTLCANVDMGTTGHTISAGVTFCGGEYSVSGNDAGWLHNNGTIESGEFKCTVENMGTVTGGTFTTALENFGTVTGGSFEGISCQSGATLSGAVEFKTLNYMSGCAVDLSEATPGGATIINGTNQELAAGSLKLPEGYALELNGNVVSSLPALGMGMIVPHSHTYETKFDATHHWEECACGKTTEKAEHSSFEYTDNGDGTHKKVCEQCGFVEIQSENHSTGAAGDKPATCNSKAYCSACESYYGEVDKTNHDSSVEYEDGFCPNGCYEPAVLNGGVYEISNAGQLYWFAAKVTGGETDIDGKLMEDITVNEGAMTAETTGAREWTIIGYRESYNDNVYYTGSFDGAGFTISGLYFNDSTVGYVGLFGSVGEGGEVQNVGVVNSYFCGGGTVGGVAGYNEGTVTNCYNTGAVSGDSEVGGVVGFNDGTVTNCYNTGAVSGTENVGGVAGYIEGTVTNCYNTGAVSGNWYVGGVVGFGNASNCYNTGDVSGSMRVGGVMGQGTVTNCYNTGAVSGDSEVGGVVGFGSASNCYYLDTAASGAINGADKEGQAEARTAEQFASGEVAYLLSQGENGDLWGQDLDNGKTKQTAPTFTGAKVYYGYRSCGDTAAKYTNDSSVFEEKPGHTGEITYAPNADGTQHIATYGCCGAEFTEAHTFDQNDVGEWVCDCTAKAVASVTIENLTGYYANFADAVTMWAEHGDILTLLADVSYDSTINIGVNVSRTFVGGDYTLDLGSNNIVNYGMLTIQSGTIKTQSATALAVYGPTTINSDNAKLQGTSFQIMVYKPEALIITGTGCDGWRIWNNYNTQEAPITIPEGFHLEDEDGNQLAANDKLPAWEITVIKANHVHNWSYTADGSTITATCEGTIGSCSDTEQSFTLNAPDVGYSGNPVEAEVTRDGTDLTFTLHYTGTNYDSADAPTSAGDYTVTMTVGDKSVSDTFTISPKDISKVASCQFSLTEISFVYSGKAPVLNVTGVDSSVGSYTMQEGTDYTVGTVQVNAGSHKLTVTGIGNYTGTVKLDYTITAREITPTVEGVDASCTYTGQAIQPTVTVKDGNTVLVKGNDYDVSYGENKNVGTGTVTVTLKGNYSGSKTVTFTIAPAPVTVTGQNKTVTYDGTDIDLRELFSIDENAGAADYTILDLTGDGSFTTAPYLYNVTKVGTFTVQVKTAATANYCAGEATAVLTVNKAEPTYTIPTGLTATYGQTLVDVKLNTATGDTPGTWKWEDTSIRLLDIGTQSFKATFTPNDTVNYSSVTGIDISVSVLQADIGQETPNPIPDQTYTGEAIEPDVNIHYLREGTDYTVSYSDNTAAGTATATITGIGNYTGEKKITFTILPKGVPDPTIELSFTSAVYTGGEIKPEVTVKDEDTVIPASEYTVSYTGNVNAGTATVTITDKEGGNYAVRGSITFEITKAAAVVTAAPTPQKTLTYTGVAQNLINGGKATGGEMQYSTDNQNWSTDIPQGTATGEYTVYYKVVGDENHSDTAVDSVEVTIAKAQAVITVDTTTITVTYGDTVNLPKATTNFGTVVCDKTADDLVNAGTYTVTYTVAGTENFEGATKTLTVKVEQLAVAEPTVTGTYTYTGKELTAQLTGVESYMTVASGNKGTNADNYEVVITLDGNHKWAEDSDGKVQWTIAKAKAEISVNTDPITITYGETVTLPNATTNFGDVVCNKKASDIVNAGTYTVTYTVAGTDNYDGDTKSITVIVNAKVITVTADALSKTYGDADPKLTYKVEGLVNGDELTGELKRVAGENVGSYAIEQNTLTAGDNYTITFTGANLTINAKAITEADVELNGSLTYTGKELTQPITVTEGITYTVIGDKATNVGTYVLTVQGTGNYTGEVKLSWSIKETAAVVTKAPAAKTLTYTGEAQELITAGEAKGGTMQYQVNGSVWSEEIPTAMDEGSYTVSYKVVGDSNHTDTEPVTLTVVIGKCTHSGNVNKDDNDCTTGVLCSVCDDVLVVTKTHVWGDWTVIKEPTTTKEGSKERPCTNDGCQVKDTLPIPMLNEVEIPDIDGGDITVDNDTPATGDDVTITVTPDPGKEVEKVTVKDETGKEIPVTKNDDGTYTYEQPDGNATVGVVLKDKVYTVTWIADGKTHAKTQYKYGETITAPADPIKEQSGCTTYNFDKWNGLTSGMTMPDNESLTFTAVFAEGESHTDSNSDHKCDRNCGKEDMGIHEDADQDHKCDYGCDKAFGEHKDAQGDGDHACDYGCGEPVESACVPGTAVRENEEEPTCEKAGSYDSVIDCTECGKELSRETVTVEAIGHAWDDGKVTKKATCTENGEKIYTCGNDKSHTRSESIPATGHAYTDEWDTACDNCGKQRIIETTPMYRMYNPNTGEHFYTGSVEERENLVSAGWNYEGVGWNAPVYIGKPVYRFYNPYTGDHHYTMDADECAAVKEAGWVYEGVAWNSASEKGVPQYRLYNPYAVTGTHNYTSSEEERDHLISLGWIYEGIGWYGMRFQ